MIVIGLTGGIASGKTFVLELFQQKFGVATISLDEEVRQLYQNPKICQKILATFPAAGRGGKLDRKILAEHVFRHPVAREQLEGILYPYLFKAVKKQLESLAAGGNELVVIETPLLFEKGNILKLCDYTITVDAPLPLRILRALRRGIGLATFVARMKQQNSAAVNKRLADFVIYNLGGKTSLYKQVKSIINETKTKKGSSSRRVKNR